MNPFRLNYSFTFHQKTNLILIFWVKSCYNKKNILSRLCDKIILTIHGWNISVLTYHFQHPRLHNHPKLLKNLIIGMMLMIVSDIVHQFCRHFGFWTCNPTGGKENVEKEHPCFKSCRNLAQILVLAFHAKRKSTYQRFWQQL